MNAKDDHDNRLWIVNDRRELVLGSIVSAIAASLAIEQEAEAAADRRIREARRHVKRMVRVSRHKVARYFRRLDKDVQKDIMRGLEINTWKVRSRPRSDRDRPPRRARQVRGRMSAAQAKCKDSLLVEVEGYNRLGFHACSLVQQLSYCYHEGGGIADHWSSAWPEVYGPFFYFDQYSGDPSTVALGEGIQYGQGRNNGDLPQRDPRGVSDPWHQYTSNLQGLPTGRRPGELLGME